MATEFISTLPDYSDLATYELATQIDFTASTTQVFSHSGITGTIAAGDTVTADSGGTGVAVAYTTPTQILLQSVSGTFSPGDTVAGPTGSVDISNAGDTAIPVMEFGVESWTESTAVQLYGATVNSVNKFIFRNAPGVPTGDPGAGAVMNMTTTFGAIGIRNYLNYSTISGFDIVATGLRQTALNDSANNSTYSHLNVDAKNSTPDVTGTTGLTLGNDCIAFNNLIYGGGYDSTAPGIKVSRFNTKKAYNNTVTGFGNGIYVDSNGSPTIEAVGNACFDNFYDDIQYITSGGTTSNNATQDTTGEITGISVADGVDMVSPSTGDYRPTSGGKLAGTGADLSTTFTDDITGTTRTIPWDIGAYIAEGGDVGETVTPNELAQGQSLGTVTLSQSHVIALNSLNQAQAVGQVALTQAYIITVNDLAQNQSLDSVTLTQAGLLAVAGISQGQLLAEVALTQASSIDPAGLRQTQNIDPVSVLSSAQLEADGLAQGQRIGSVSLAIAGAIAANSLRQGQELGTVTLQQAGSITVQDLSQAQTLAEVELIQGYAVQVASLLQGQALDSVTMTLGGALVSPDSITQGQTLGSPALEEFAVIQVNDLTQAQLLDVVRFGGVVIGEVNGTLVLYSLLDGNLVLH